MKVQLDLSNYSTKADLKSAICVDTSDFAKNIDLANLKFDVGKLDIDELKNVPPNLNGLKSKLDKHDVDKLVPVPIDLSQLSNLVKHDVMKKDVYNTKIKNFEGKIRNITNLATNTTINSKINEVKNEMPSITNLATTTATTTTILTAVENKIPNVSNLVKKTDYNTKISEFKNKNYY